MPDPDPDPSQRTKSSHLLNPQLLGGISLLLWGTAIGWTTITAEFVWDRPKALQLVRGLLTINIALAMIATLIWYLAKYYLLPAQENRAIHEYLYRAGYRDATMKLLQSRELHLVRPTPPPTPADQPQPRDYLVKQNGHRTKAPT